MAPSSAIETADDPDADEERRTGQLGRHLARRPEDPDQDGVADEHRDAERDAEDLAQPAPAGGRDQRGSANDMIRAIGGIGQLEGPLWAMGYGLLANARHFERWREIGSLCLWASGFRRKAVRFLATLGMTASPYRLTAVPPTSSPSGRRS